MLKFVKLKEEIMHQIIHSIKNESFLFLVNFMPELSSFIYETSENYFICSDNI